MKTSANILLGALAAAMTVVVTPVVAQLPTASAIPGGLVVQPLYSSEYPPPQAMFGRRNIRIEEYGGFWWGLAGIGLDTIPGEYVISVTANDEPPRAISFRIKPHSYPLTTAINSAESRLSLLGLLLNVGSGDRNEAPDLPIKHWQYEMSATLPLSYPAEGGWQDFFGHREATGRDMSVSQHHLQLEGLANQLVSAPGRGLCLDIRPYSSLETGEQPTRFTVTLDHGSGLISIIDGVSDLTIQQGDEVQQKAMIGRFSSPGTDLDGWLKWSVVLNGEYVNPALLTVASEYPLPGENVISFPWMQQAEEVPAADTM